jgi:hypothetical protein
VDSNSNSSLSKERELEEVLLSDADPIAKVRRLIAMGMEEEAAEEVVQSYLTGQSAPVYYERLEFDRNSTDQERADRSEL